MIKRSPPATSFVSGDEQLDLTFDQGTSLVQPPKRQKTSKRGGSAWDAAYSSFSQEFAYSAVRVLNPPACSVILDAFVGAGTSYTAARLHGCNLIGIDLNPYSALMTKVRSAVRADPRLVRRILSQSRASSTAPNVPAEVHNIFRSIDLQYLSGVSRTLKRRLTIQSTGLLDILLHDKSGTVDSETVALASALRAAKDVAKMHRRSNPAWLVVGDDPQGPSPPAAIQERAHQYAEMMLKELAQCRNSRIHTWCEVYAADFADVPIPDKSICYFLTSPPYMNRLDYVVSYLPQLAALSLFLEIDVQGLRERMMGTTKMRPEPHVDRDILNSSVVHQTLDRIRLHPSQASRGYYYRFYRQYFSDLSQFFNWLRLKCCSGAHGILVFQDSFYKEFRIPLLDIVTDLAEACDFSVETLLLQTKRNHMGAMSPIQQHYAPKKTLHEHVLLVRVR